VGTFPCARAGGAPAIFAELAETDAAASTADMMTAGRQRLAHI
jgi:hypothetical protein